MSPRRRACAFTFVNSMVEVGIFLVVVDMVLDAVAEEVGDECAIHPRQLEEFRESPGRVFTESVVGVAGQFMGGWFEG